MLILMNTYYHLIITLKISDEKVSKRDMLMNDFIEDYFKVLSKLDSKNNQQNK